MKKKLWMINCLTFEQFDREQLYKILRFCIIHHIVHNLFSVNVNPEHINLALKIVFTHNEVLNVELNNLFLTYLSFYMTSFQFYQVKIINNGVI